MIEVAFRNILIAPDSLEDQEGQPILEESGEPLVSEDVTVASLVGDRVYFGNRPQDERRASVILNLISAIPGMTFQGRGGYFNGRMQVTCLAPTYQQAKVLAQAARDELDGFRGVLDGTTVAYIETEDFKDIPAMPLPGGAQPATYGVSIDCRFMVKE